MYELDNPYYLYLLFSLPVVAILYFAMTLWRRKARRSFGDLELLQKMAPERSANKHVFRFILGLLVLASLSIALVNPKIGTSLNKAKREGVDIVFALDVSKSMLAEDILPNRLEKAKQIISKTLDNLVADRVGIIIYAGQAYPQLPITTDYGAARLFLKSIDTDIIPSKGTAIADAVDLASQYYNDDDQQNRVLVILSDGEDHEQGYVNAVKKALEQGIKTYTIGLGTQQGAPIPEYNSRGFQSSFKKDKQGEIVVSQLNTKLLKEIAQIGGGEFFNGKDIPKTVEFLMTTMEGLEKKEFEANLYSDYEDQFQWFLAIALFLLVVDIFILERKTQWIKKLNLFENDKDNH